MSRTAIVLTALVSSTLVVEPVWRNDGPAFIWNASASVPIGLYWLAPVSRVEAPDLVVVEPPEPLATFLAKRGYLPRGVPLIKRVLAIAGDKVCRHGAIIIAFGHAYGVAREKDSLGRPLPVWQGCRTLADGEIFFMNWDAADSLDGRYFGPLPASSIVARALPVWTDADGDGDFDWHVGTPTDAP
ncbi:S26 family signal peptidase [Mesorhizobium sp. M5C.F.Ca.IN.020.32.2.1]|uniref:S26 family signal peptidase n=1 Tax=Mesorhizobium sp. M5C.F.Ca.IN.020.32.2.1 TaxID=2496771 RepID=UPI000FD41A6B|nr:S26 family signal peptidase [Mesorhizobium sp. M5C.F.Ca.IN.020.32.2.1]RUV27577.1 S26 family signal peptidase [Mesorhizobium sp. M5C.F.Ca.IN.020.32.2.1]